MKSHLLRNITFLCSVLLLFVGAFPKASAQAPVITSFSPASGAVGTTATITGTGFNPVAANNIVYFGSVKATVTAATSTSLTVTVPAGATYQPISVTTGSLTGYSALPFTATFSCSNAAITSNSFSSQMPFPAGPAPEEIAIGDIDGDGRPDVVTANRNSNSVSIVRNTSSNGTLSFAPKVNISAPRPTNIVLADLNGDGKLDLVTGNQGSGGVITIMNLSTPGTLAFGETSIWLSSRTSDRVAVGDLNGDGKPDVAEINRNSSTVTVSRNASGIPGAPPILLASGVSFPIGTNPEDIVIGDVDGDGKPDLVTSGSANTISVHRNTSTGDVFSFASRVDFPTRSEPRGLVFGDFDGDGKLDLAVANSTLNSTTIGSVQVPADNYVSVFRNTSSIGTIALNRQDFSTGTAPYDIAVGDLNGDGKPDLATANITTFLTDKVIVLANTSSSGNLSFAAPVQVSKQGEEVGPSLAIGDLDMDGKSDLAVAGYGTTFSVLRNQITCPTTCTPPTFLNNGLIVLDASCGRNDGGIWLVPTSGTGPFQYSINGGQTYVSAPGGIFGFQNLAAGTYQLRIKDANGCESAIVERQVRNYYNCPGSAITRRMIASELSSLSGGTVALRAYPNPNRGVFRVQLRGISSQRVQLSVVDTRGMIIQQRVVAATEGSTVEVNLSGKAKGMYFVRVVNEKGVQFTKVLIQ